MAVYTDVAFEDLERLLGDYAIGDAKSFKGIAEGVENSNFLLQTTTGDYILTLYEKRVSAGDLPFFLGLLDHLAMRGIPCPLPVHTKAGARWTELNGRPAAVLTYLDGLSLRRPEASHCAAVGTALADLHEAGRDFSLVRPNALSLKGWHALAEATIGEADGVQKGLAALITSSLAGLDAAWPGGLPSGVIHADLFPDNVLFLHDKVSGLIDFYFACNDAYAYDLAVMLNAWCFEDDGSYNVTKGRALVNAYAARRALSQGEYEALPLLARGAALRFLLTRLFDWLRRDPNALVRPKDPLDYARRLRFHLSVKTAGGYGL
ncbi:MAG TPA: homoserine kinase [Rhizomicrobium sp.]|nr:homoserine kinase [Rhizomicrobium sp.]